MSRVRRAVWASVVVAFLACGPLGPFVLAHAGAEDDRGCDLAVIAVPATTAPQVVHGRATAPPDHCAVCHWLHLLRGATPRHDGVVLAGLGASGLAYHGDGDPAVARSFPCSGRSPPLVVS